MGAAQGGCGAAAVNPLALHRRGCALHLMVGHLAQARRALGGAAWLSG